MVWKWDPAPREISQIPWIWLSEQSCYYPAFLLHWITWITTSDCLSEQEQIKESGNHTIIKETESVSPFSPSRFIYLFIYHTRYTHIFNNKIYILLSLGRFTGLLPIYHHSNSLNFCKIEGFLHGKGFPSFLLHHNHKETIRSFHVILVYFQLCHFPA